MMKKINKYKNYIILLIVTIIISCLFVITNKYIRGNDTIYHLANIKSITKDFLNLNFTKINGYLLNGLGYGGRIFYPKFPHYIASFINIPFYLLGMDVTYSIKILEFIIIYLSGLFMYKLLNKIYKNEKTSLFGSIIYITNPFFIYDLYIRNCLNEFCLFAILPIIFLSLEYLKEDNEKIFILLFSIGYILLINTHLVLGVYFTFLLIIYLLINYKVFLTKKNIISFIKSSIIILIICLPNLILLLEHKSLNIYAVFQDNYMATLDNMKKFSLRLYDFIIPYKKMLCFINIIVLIGIVISTIYLIIDKNNKSKKNIISIGILILISIFMSTKYFPYKILPNLLLSIQFPIRCVLFVSFFVTIYSIYYMNYLKEKQQNIVIVISSILSIIILLPVFISLYLNNLTILKYNKYSGLGWQHEYLTINALKTNKYLTKENKIESLNNNKVKIKEIKNTTPNLIAQISNVKKTTTLELPRLYYLGYNIKYKTKTKTYKLKYKLDKYGFIKVNIKESGTIYVKYTGTILYNIFRIIRLIFIIVLLITYIYKTKLLKE